MLSNPLNLPLVGTRLLPLASTMAAVSMSISLLAETSNQFVWKLKTIMEQELVHTLFKVSTEASVKLKGATLKILSLLIINHY